MIHNHREFCYVNDSAARYVYNVNMSNPPHISSYGSAKPFTWDHHHLVARLGQSVIYDPLLLNAFRAVDRIHFVPATHKNDAYNDSQIPLGYGEKMSSPTTVAQYLQLLAPKYGGKYLHLGTGSGYLATILSQVAGDTGKVFSMERINWIWRHAREGLQHYPSIAGKTEFLLRDGQFGLEDKAPFDAIIISYALVSPPQHLLRQVKPGGKLIWPDTDYHLNIIELSPSGLLTERIPGFIYEIGKPGTA